MKTMMLNGSTFLTHPLWAPEGAAGGDGGVVDGGADAAAAVKAADPASVLFPDESNGKTDAGEGDKAGKDASAGDWKEYVSDPNKSEAENAAAKAEHDKTKPDDNGNDKNDPANQVPADGKYTLTMPEGVEVDQGLLDALSPKFAAKGLTNGDVQELVGEFIKVQQARGEEYAKSPEGSWSVLAHAYFTEHGTPDKWADTAKADAEIGGAKWDATTAAAKLAVSKLGTPALREYLNKSGGGNHPELIRFMAKVGAVIGEDKPTAGGAGGNGKPADPAHVLFPNDAPKG